MSTINFYRMLKPHFSTPTIVRDTRLMREFLLKTMLGSGSIFLVSVYTFMLKIIGFIAKYAYRSNSSDFEENGSNFSDDRSQKCDDSHVSNNSTVFSPRGLAGKGSLDSLEKSEDDTNNIGGVADTEDSVLVQSGLISNSSKYQFTCDKIVNKYLEEPKAVKFSVQEMFVGSNEVNFSSDDQSLDCEISRKKELEEINKEEFDEEPYSSSFSFSLFNASCSTNEFASPVYISEVETIGQKREEVYEERENLNYDGSKDFPVEGLNSVDEILEDQDFCYELQFSIHGANQESDASGNDILVPQKIESTNEVILEENDEFGRIKPEYFDIKNSLLGTESVEDLDEEFIELENLSVGLTQISQEITPSCGDAKMTGEELPELDSTKQQNCWDSDSDSDDEDDTDVLSEHQHLVQQMKMELKNCRIGGLPTISEENESPKMIEDLKPLEIDRKIEYKDVMEEIQKFYKSYVEKMRKLDILNYQTLHAISFLQLKESEVFTAGKKKADSLPFHLQKILPHKVHRIHADPMRKSMAEMHRDLELVYVGQLCLSWEILSWLYVRARDLLKYDCEGNQWYNRAAEEFQQFQVLMQRFMEDEQFLGHRNLNYVKNRCTMRSLLQVPTIKDDCSKAKKEITEETDAFSLELLLEMIRESMVIFRDFLFTDKKSTNVVLKGVQGAKIDLQEPVNSGFLVDIVSTLQKKERRVRDLIRSQNCIVKKMRKHQECRSNVEILTSQVELRLVSRVLILSRLTTDQLVWCQKKLDNINFVGRKVHVEPSFLLFPS